MTFMQLALKNETGKGNIAAMYLCTKLQDITLFSLQYPYLHFFLNVEFSCQHSKSNNILHDKYNAAKNILIICTLTTHL